MFEVFVTDKETGDVKVFETVDNLYLCAAHIDGEKEQASVHHYYFGGGLGYGCAAHHAMAHMPESINTLGREFAERFTHGVLLAEEEWARKTVSGGTHDSRKSDIEMVRQAVRDAFADKEGV